MLNFIHNVIYTVPLGLQQLAQAKSNPKYKIWCSLGNPNTAKNILLCSNLVYFCKSSH